MEYVVPLVIVLVIVVVVVVAARVLGRRNKPSGEPADQGSEQPQTKTSGRNQKITREAAQDASSRLTPEDHRRVYALIAQQQIMNAVQEYRKATRCGLGEAAAAVAALAQFPQPTPEPTPAPSLWETPEPPAVAQVSPTPDVAEVPKVPVNDVEPQVPDLNSRLTVEDIINAAPAPGPAPAPKMAKPATGYRYRAIVSQGDDIREVASTRLNEQIFSEIKGLALAGNYDGAARLLLAHADIGETEAREFVTLIGPDA